MSWYGFPWVWHWSQLRFILFQGVSYHNCLILSNCMYSASERVEFFQSESEFDSESSLNHSRYFDFTNEIISQTDNVFLTLKRQLLPNENLLHGDKIKYALTRAQLLHKDTIPEHLGYLQKIEAPANATVQVEACGDKLDRLLKDYDSLKNNTMIYKQFFNVYGREYGATDSKNFQKGEEKVLRIDDSQAVLQQECIQINYSTRAKLKATPRVFMAASPANNDKQVSNLREEIHILKKSMEDMKRQQEVDLTNQRLTAEKRIRTYLQAQMSGNGVAGSTVSSELQQYSFKVSCSQEQIRGLRKDLDEKERLIEMLKSENSMLQSEVETLRKRDINLQEENVHDKSYNTEFNDKEDRRTEKRLKIALYQNDILKNQLKTERQKLYRLTSDLTEEERRELERFKKQLQRRTQQFDKLQGDFDKQRIEIAQLSHNYKVASKLTAEVKDQNQELKRKFQLMTKQPTLMSLPPTDSQPQMEVSQKLHISAYEGDGIEGLPYYDILSKQFKVRFRRACLKQKELLQKANGLEIGVISAYEKPNKMNLLIHLTNYGDINFKRVKGKILNANQNKIGGQTFQFAEIAQNDQIKIPLSLIVTHYPLGPLILLLEYHSDKREELRLLLPSHIFKMMQFEQLKEPLKNGQGISIVTERKILKGLGDFKQYVKGANCEDGVVKLSAYHRQTHTELHFQLVETKDGVDLIYRHYEGNSQISQYFIKTLAFLLRK